MTAKADPTGDTLLYHLKKNHFEFDNYCRNYINSKYPPNGFLDYQFNFVKVGTAYFDLANMTNYIKGNKDAIATYKAVHETYWKASWGSLQAICSELYGRLEGFRKADKQLKDPRYLVDLADDLAGTGFTLFNGLTPLTKALAIPGFKDALPKDAIMSADDIKTFQDEIKSAVLRWRSTYEELYDEQKNFLKEVYKERQVGGPFPYDDAEEWQITES